MAEADGQSSISHGKRTSLEKEAAFGDGGNRIKTADELADEPGKLVEENERNMDSCEIDFCVSPRNKGNG